MDLNIRTAFLSLGCILLVACSQPKPKTAAKLYPLSGQVVTIDLKEHTAMIDAKAVPNFMDAMKMDYPIASDADLASLKVGESIQATIQVSEDGSYSLLDIHKAK